MAPILFGLAVLCGAVGVLIAGFSLDGGGAPLGQVLSGVGLLIAAYVLGVAGWRMEKRRQGKWPD